MPGVKQVLSSIHPGLSGTAQPKVTIGGHRLTHVLDAQRHVWRDCPDFRVALLVELE